MSREQRRARRKPVGRCRRLVYQPRKINASWVNTPCVKRRRCLSMNVITAHHWVCERFLQRAKKEAIATVTTASRQRVHRTMTGDVDEAGKPPRRQRTGACRGRALLCLRIAYERCGAPPECARAARWYRYR